MQTAKNVPWRYKHSYVFLSGIDRFCWQCHPSRGKTSSKLRLEGNAIGIKRFVNILHQIPLCQINLKCFVITVKESKQLRKGNNTFKIPGTNCCLVQLTHLTRRVTSYPGNESVLITMFFCRCVWWNTERCRTSFYIPKRMWDAHQRTDGRCRKENSIKNKIPQNKPSWGLLKITKVINTHTIFLLKNVKLGEVNQKHQ